MAAVPAGAAAQPDTDYTLGPRDVLHINVFNETELSGEYTVESDGTLSFPLIGRIEAAGLTLPAFEDLLRARLADGYFREPRITAAIAEHRSRRVFVIGEVRQPGAYPLTGRMSLIEALATAGSTSPLAADEALIVRADHADGPLLPHDEADSETIRIDLRELRTGTLAQNVMLRDGDTVFVPRAETVYVFGEVRQPGSYPVRADTTVLQVLSLAGGATEFGALNRVRISRIVNGKQTEIRVDLTDVVQPDDTVIVPERFF